MKRYSKLAALVVVLAVICIAAFAVNRHEEQKEKIKNSDETILSINDEDVTAISWEYEDHSYAFHKDGSWTYDSDSDFPVSQDEIKKLLDVFSSFDVAFTIDDVEDYGQYGLDDPVCTIKFTAGDKDYEVKLGDYSKMDEQRYVSIGDGKVYLAANDPFDTYEVEMTDLIQNDEIPDLSDVTELTFAGSQSYTSKKDDNKLTYDSDDKYFVEDGGEMIALDTANVDSYIKNITDLTLTDYVTYNAGSDELKKYGLDDPAMTVTVAYNESSDDSDDKSGDTEEKSGEFTLNISKAFDGDGKVVDEKDSDDSTDVSDDISNSVAYVRIGDSSIIYKIGGTTYSNLMAAGVDELRHQQLIWADSSIITGMDFTIDGETYKFTSEKTTKKSSDSSDGSDGSDSSDRTWTYNKEEIDVSDVTTALAAVTAKTFTDTDPDQKEEIGVTVYLDNENVSKVELTFYRYDGSTCIAKQDGETIARVDRSSVVDLIEAVNAIVLKSN